MTSIGNTENSNNHSGFDTFLYCIQSSPAQDTNGSNDHCDTNCNTSPNESSCDVSCDTPCSAYLTNLVD